MNLENQTQMTAGPAGVGNVEHWTTWIGQLVLAHSYRHHFEVLQMSEELSTLW